MKKNLLRLLVVALTVYSFSSCGEAPKESDLSIKEIIHKHYADRDFTLGASSRTSYLTTQRNLLDIWKKEFPHNTLENDFKQSGVYPEPGAQWNDTAYMAYIQIARENEQTIRAHCPISPQASRWICEDARTGEEMEPVLIHYATGIYKDIEANKDVIKWMDVVNETIACNDITGNGYNSECETDEVTYKRGEWFGPRAGTTNWENPWPKMGFVETEFEGEPYSIPRYIPLAFSLADEYAPSIKHVINQHGDKVDIPVWDNIFKMVRYLRSEGYRVDGVAFQAHIAEGWEKDPENKQELQQIIDMAHALDLEFHISELDIKYDGEIKDLDAEQTAVVRAAQAETIGAVVELILQNIDKGVVSLNFWTMADNRWEEGKTFCNLMEEDGSPLPSYHKVKELLLKYAK
ncbi:MAG: endo-1,4-beta-xylanase [Rikenellaceae bacterium]